ncbi:hypothetical protein FB45DRAFT_72226 [Roridomyces roridus]|uniref:Uncharacterized protein n=1 Tax=Roridomyces roridus TaxID=1738132 RepID=A0AAD7BMX1_9AGAR|nr:hypothetical protein FB45DRAFT_72226 [Roridomyces roridus]
MLFEQFKGCATYLRESGAVNMNSEDFAICVKRDPIGISVAHPNSNHQWVKSNRLESGLSRWQCEILFGQVAGSPAVARFSHLLRHGAGVSELAGHLDWLGMFHMLTPVWIDHTRMADTNGAKWFLGSVMFSPDPWESAYDTTLGHMSPPGIRLAHHKLDLGSANQEIGVCFRESYSRLGVAKNHFFAPRSKRHQPKIVRN